MKNTKHLQIQRKLNIKSHNDKFESIKLKEFFEQKLTVNSETNTFKYIGIDMTHSNEYASNVLYSGSLIQKYFGWIPRISQIFVKNLISEIDVCFGDYLLLQNSSCFDPRKFVFFLL